MLTVRRGGTTTSHLLSQKVLGILLNSQPCVEIKRKKLRKDSIVNWKMNDNNNIFKPKKYKKKLSNETLEIMTRSISSKNSFRSYELGGKESMYISFTSPHLTDTFPLDLLSSSSSSPSTAPHAMRLFIFS